MARNELTPNEIRIRNIISSRLNNLLDESNRTQADLSRDLNIAKSTLNGYFKGTSTPSPGNIQKLSDYFNVNKSDIDPRFEQVPSNVMKINSETVKIPLLGVIACGDPITAVENIDNYIEVVKEGLPTGDLFYVKASGESMMPQIPNGSNVLCRAQKDCENGEIASVLVNGNEEATLKKVRKTGGLVILEPLNNDYESYVVTPENPATIIGKALKVTFDL